MKKILFSICGLMLAMGIMAANKPVVYVDYFDYAESVGEAKSEQVRSGVISGLTSFNHIQVQDVDAAYGLKQEDARRSSEAAMSDATARAGEMRQLGANYLIEGYVSQIVTVWKAATELTKAHYEATLMYTIKLIDCENGTVAGAEDYKEYGSGATTDEAISKCFNTIKGSMSTFVKKYFKMEGIIIDSDYTISKGKMTACYISLGTDDGIQKGVKMEVSVPRVIQGNVTYNKVGELTVQEVVAGSLSQCKVTKGQKELAAAMEEYVSVKAADPANAHPMKVLSKEQTFFGSLFGN